MITGVDLAYEDLDGEKPEGFESGPTENPEDDDVEMDPDERPSWPDPTLIAAWWERHNGEFQQGTRYLLGKPISCRMDAPSAAHWAPAAAVRCGSRTRDSCSRESKCLRFERQDFDSRRC